MDVNGTSISARASPWAGASPDLIDTASVSCARSERIGWPRAACIASTVGASTLPCPTSLGALWSTRSHRIGFASTTVQSMGCRADGKYVYSTFEQLNGDEGDVDPRGMASTGGSRIGGGGGGSSSAPLTVPAMLSRIGLERYASAFETAGYDDLRFLQVLGEAKLRGVLAGLSMKPGHTHKLVDFLLGGVSRHREAIRNGTYVAHGEFNRTSAWGINQRTCQTFKWAHRAKGPRKIRSGPAIVGADKDIAKALAGGRLGSVSLLHLGMDPRRRERDGLWTPCTNLAFIVCAIRGWLPGQGGPRFHLATRGDAIGKRCRPCGACDTSRGQKFFDECYIVKNELCMLARACKNGGEVWTRAGEWVCEPR